MSKRLDRCVPYALAVLVATLATDARGKARYAGKAEMIRESEAVAVVDISGVEEAEVKGEHWTYRQKAAAKVESVLKGELPEELELHGGEDFICARCEFAPGRYLVFLKRDGNLWAGSNWHLSARKVSGETVDWYADDTGIETKPAPLADVLAEVRELIAEPKPDA
jgi:hypothetical protein